MVTVRGSLRFQIRRILVAKRRIRLLFVDLSVVRGFEFRAELLYQFV